MTKNIPSWLDLELTEAKKLVLGWYGNKLKIQPWLGSDSEGFEIFELSSAWAWKKVQFLSWAQLELRRKLNIQAGPSSIKLDPFGRILLSHGVRC